MDLLEKIRAIVVPYIKTHHNIILSEFTVCVIGGEVITEDIFAITEIKVSSKDISLDMTPSTIGVKSNFFLDEKGSVLLIPSQQEFFYIEV